MQFTNQLLLEFRHNFLIYKHPIAGIIIIELSILALGGLGKGGGGVERGGHVYFFSFSTQKNDYIVTLSKHVRLG